MVKREKWGKYFIKNIIRCKYLYIMFLPGFAYYIIFNYGPMYGAQIAFRDFNAYEGFWNSPWVGFKHFEAFFNNPYFFRLLRNTLTISISNLLFGFPAPIILALLLNEVRKNWVKRSMQTLLYLPHFISQVVVCGMIIWFTSLRGGVINNLITTFGGEAVHFMAQPKWFVPVYVISGIWENIGWGSIVFLAALAGIAPSLYEAAIVDGAGKFNRMIHITLPSILPTIIIMFIMRMGNMFSVGHSKILLLYNPATYETADVISTYVYRRGMLGADFSFSSAVDLFNSLCDFILIVIFNKISQKIGETSLW